jgi:hypothetical protein
MTLALFFALYCLEAGLFFIVVPWTRVWTFSPLWHHDATLTMLAMNPFVRGFVSGFGVVHIIMGVRDIIALAQVHRAEQLEERHPR